MYRNVLRLITGKYYLYSICLCFCLFSTAILNGVGIGLIGPLLEVNKSGESSNFLIKIFHDIFQYCGIGLSIINILFLVLAIVVLGTIFTVVTVYLQNQIQLNHEIAQKGYLYNLLSNVHINTLYGLNFGNVIQVIQQETRMSAKLIEYFVRSISGLLNASVFLALVFIISIKMTIRIISVRFGGYQALMRIHTPTPLNFGRLLWKSLIANASYTYPIPVNHYF